MFSRKGIVSVTINYRLGVFGFMAHPELSAENSYKGSGNYALMDQNVALKWVQENIKAFGGDPSRVTIAGESCGSRSVCAQMASPLSKGLFSAAIGESGALMNSTIVPLSLKDAEKLGLQFAEVAKKKSIKELRALTAQELLEISGLPNTPYFAPNVDNNFFPDFPSKIFERGEQAKVPLLAGWNSEEMNYRFIFGQNVPTVENYNKILENLYGEYALGNLPTNRVYDWQPEDFMVSTVMQEFFANFIKTHNPNGLGVPEWPAANENINVQMHIDVESEAEIDPNSERYKWLNQLPAKYVSAPE